MGTGEIVFTNAKLADGIINKITVAGGCIRAINPPGSDKSQATTVYDVAGALLVPSFVEGRIHLDTSFYCDK